ncbi:hypothetical protein VM1G_11980 [Cytospora mali]|uniref:Uncharacterized protein n=1 Tax=Cytospora mali TaxID=578113 RepID=A0A194WE75_CYTMA|nr:hypothetical protein VM1G_11980 [Valsa mali]
MTGPASPNTGGGCSADLARGFLESGSVNRRPSPTTSARRVVLGFAVTVECGKAVARAAREKLKRN